MTTRQNLKRCEKKAAVWMGIGMLTAAVGVFLAHSHTAAGVFLIIGGILTVVIGQFWMLYEGRCVHCRRVISDTHHRRSFGKRFQFCPYCGVSLDEPLGGQPNE